MIRLRQLFFATIAVMGVSCSAHSGDNITPAAFQKAVAVDSSAVVLDVRTAAEFSEGHLPNAINLDYLDTPTFMSEINDLTSDHVYYVYCKSGRRSLEACKLLRARGLKAVNMLGGIEGWKKEKLPLTIPKR